MKISKNKKIIAIIIIVIICLIAVYFLFIKISALRTGEILVYSHDVNSTVVLFKKANRYEIIQSAGAPVKFKNIPSGIYMVAVSIDNSTACSYTQVVDLRFKKKVIINAEINQNKLCLD